MCMPFKKFCPFFGCSIPTLASMSAIIRSMRAEELVQKKVKDISDFEWLKQCRFYWHDEKDTVIISICDRDFEYSFEYLGVTPFVPLRRPVKRNLPWVKPGNLVHSNHSNPHSMLYVRRC